VEEGKEKTREEKNKNQSNFEKGKKILTVKTTQQQQQQCCLRR